jgi:hypothetical protein
MPTPGGLCTVTIFHEESLYAPVDIGLQLKHYYRFVAKAQDNQVRQIEQYSIQSPMFTASTVANDM